MKRRDFLKLTTLPLIASLYPAGKVLWPIMEKWQRKNILFLCIDDLNDWVGCLKGHPQTKTPHLDQLARESLLFPNAYCQVPVCGPSRVSFLTGQSPARTHLFKNLGYFKQVYPELITFPEYLRTQNYFVAGTGKIFHGGFDFYQGEKAKTAAFFHDHFLPGAFEEFFPVPSDFIPAERPRNTFEKKEDFYKSKYDNQMFDWGSVPNGVTSDEKIVNWATSFFARSDLDKRPFFLGVGLYRPHLPMYVPEEFYKMHPLDKVELPLIDWNDLEDLPAAALEVFHIINPLKTPSKEHLDLFRSVVQSYLAAVSFLDSNVGKILQALKTSAHAENTLVVLLSDNGWHVGEKLYFTKNTLWERATHVPLMIKDPLQKSHQGRVVKKPVSLVDVYPTLLDWAKLKKPATQTLDGTSLLGDLKDHSPIAFSSIGEGMYGIRTEKFRYIQYKDHSEELYDLTNDPREWKNLALNPFYKNDIEMCRAYLNDYLAKHPTYKPKNFVVKNWGSQSTRRGVGFNLQPDGSSALWFLGEAFTPGVKVFWQEKLLNTAYGGETSLSALLPLKEIQRSGVFSLTLRDQFLQREEVHLTFTVS